MTQALYLKWRPHHWEQVMGQEHVIHTLHNAVATQRVAHAYLFAGPRGTGKTTTARLLAKAVNCLDADLANRPCDECEPCQAVNAGRFLDLIEIDAASNTSVEDVRSLRDKINFSPNQGRYKVYIVDEVHMLSTAAFNALLKTLEEPPAHAIFILATTEIHKIPATVLSRCQRHEFRRIPVVDIVAKLKVMAERENIEAEPDALTLIARQATGAMRDAESLLDQLASAGRVVTLEMAQEMLGTATSESVLEVVEARLAKEAAAGLKAIHRTLDAGSDPRQFARQIVDYLRDLLLVRMGNAAQVETTAEIRSRMAKHAEALDVADILKMIDAFNRAANEARLAWQPALPLEVALVESLTGLGTMAPAGSPVVSGQAGQTPPDRTTAATVKKAVTPQPTFREAEPPGESELAAPGEETTTPGTSDGDVLKNIQENWGKILSLVRQQNASLYALLNSHKTRRVRGNVLTLGFATEILKVKMEAGNNCEITQSVIQQVTGLNIIVQVQTVTGQRNAPPSDVDTDGMVASAIRDLGGKIVDIQ